MRILLLEDNIDHAEIIISCLSYEQDVESKWVKNIADAIKTLENDQNFDAVLSDLRLPGSEIEDTFDFIKSFSASLPFIVLTTLNDIDTAKKALQAGAQDYIVKSELRPYIINRSLEYALERYRLRNEVIESNKKLKNFTALLAHDFISPIANISRGVELLQLKTTDKSDMAQTILKLLKDQTDSSIKLIKSLHQTSKLQLSEDVKKEKQDIELIVKKVIKNIEETDFTIDVSTEGEIFGNEEQLIILIQNLLLNSIKHKKDDELKIVIKHSTFPERDVIVVSDNGKGIQEEILPLLFEAFKKDSNSGGIGLGLYNVKQIIDMHGGKIKAKPDEKNGATFIIELPKKPLLK